MLASQAFKTQCEGAGLKEGCACFFCRDHHPSVPLRETNQSTCRLIVILICTCDSYDGAVTSGRSRKVK
ncbi:UNVERIFIED_CONTAM: hypothetical protein FKN15_067432 [Acipenser sinensis]